LDTIIHGFQSLRFGEGREILMPSNINEGQGKYNKEFLDALEKEKEVRLLFLNH